MKKIIIMKESPLEYFIPFNIDEISNVSDGKLVEISEEEFELLKSRKMCIFENGKVVLDILRKERAEKMMEAEFLKNELAKTDYMAIKFAEQAVDEAKYAPIREQRKAWRERINELGVR